MNNEYLRVNSKDEQEGIVEGVYTAKAESKPERDDSSTLYSLFRHKKGKAIDLQGSLPGISKAFWTFLIFTFVAVFLTLVAFFTKSADALAVVAIIASLALPIFAIAVFYELNASKNVSYIEILGGVAIGVAYFFIEKILTNYLTPLTFNHQWIEKFLFVPVFDLGLILISYFYVKCLKKVNLF
ncbi:MAG: hypothetical protein J5836_01630, partial [Clostridia bacterium]|nr:hypothetical protein [Clostridia bacterium]